MVDSLIEVSETKGSSLKKSLKQLKNAKKNKNKNQVKSLQKQTKELQEQLLHIEEIMLEIIDDIFTHSYKDVCADIRALSLECLTGWILSHPDLFLEDKYTKFIGWLLNDKV